MAKLAHYDATGAILGFYDADLHVDIPEPNIEISDVDWLDHICGRPKQVQAGKIVDQLPSLEEVRAEALARMRAWIAEFVGQFTQGVPAAELASWPAKAAAARAFLATGIEQSLISAEAAVTGEPADRLAKRIASKAEAYEHIIARVTGLRRATEAAVTTAETPAEIQAALEKGLRDAKSMILALGLEQDNAAL